MQRLLFLFALALPVHAGAVEPVQAFEGPSADVQIAHLIPKPTKSETYSEQYTFKARLGGRGTLDVSIRISNLGADRKLVAKATLTVDGRTIDWTDSFDADAWSFDSKVFRIEAGPLTLSGTPERMSLVLKAADSDVTCTWSAIAKAWRPKDGQVRFGKGKKAADFTVFPLMKVALEGTVKGAAVKAEGVGYGNHDWAELPIYDQARWSREFRGVDGDKAIYLREFLTAEDYGQKIVQYILVTQGDQVVIESFDFATRATEVLTDNRHANRYKVPESFTLQGFGAKGRDHKFRGRITKKRQLRRQDVLQQMKPGPRLIAARYSKPVQYDYRADFHVQVKTPAGEVVELRGVGRYEVHHWNK